MGDSRVCVIYRLRLLAPYQPRPLSFLISRSHPHCPPLTPSTPPCSLFFTLFVPMRKLFNRDKPKPTKVTPASREVPPDLTSVNSSEVNSFSSFSSLINNTYISSQTAGLSGSSTPSPPLPSVTTPPPAPSHPSVPRHPSPNPST